MKTSVEQSETASNPDLSAPSAEIPPEFINNPAYLLRVAQEATFRSFKAHAENAALKPGWYALLTFLLANPGATPSELSAVCGRDRSTLSFTLKALLHANLVEKIANPKDQRSYGLVLTVAGHAAQAHLHSFAIEHETRLGQILGSDQDQFIAVLKRIISEI